ncbi:carboxypeptidase-like regulatory domain-containing protein [Mesonia sp.]|uniref:carboxypeptidase-like regulatory domain-containing protein n=1 Tax=Mesonia sp. TaxID=1960830 RepID=UPI003F9CC593
MKYLCLWLFILCYSSLFSQTKIEGKTTNELGKPIPNATITISALEGDEILAYAISSSKGYFQLDFINLEKKIQIEVRSMGYAPISQSIANKNTTIDFVLEDRTTELKEVVVNAAPITRKGDTLNYSVNSFAQEQDRTLADVLKRMPGIEVLSNGKILYQGEPINKYYIENLDLLEGKYDLANKNLPHNKVAKIQVLENHQPVKLLDSLVFSDQAALNIKLKNEVTFTGQAEIGSGFSPVLWEANISPMLFTGERQVLISYQTNNTGEDAATQLETLSVTSFTKKATTNSKKQDWLNLTPINTPNFAQKRWLDNNIHLISANYLQKLKKEYKMRLNVSYVNDYQQRSGATETKFYTPNDTITLFENKYNRFFTNTLETKVSFEKNTNTRYFKDDLQFNGFWDSKTGSILQENAFSNQNLNNKFFNFSNNLKNIFSVGKQLITLKSYLSFNQTPQKLAITPGPFTDLLNDEKPYDQVYQEVDLQSFYTNNSVGFTKAWKSFNFSPQLGFQIEKQKLQSKLTTSENSDLSNQFSNDLDWMQSKVYLKLQTQYEKNKWRIELKTPVNFYSFSIKDKALFRKENLKRLYVEPTASIIYDANAFWKFKGSASINNDFGKIDQLHYAYILKSYRNIMRSNTPLPKAFNKNISNSISYRNPIKSFFWNIYYTFTESKKNLLYKTQVFENGATELQAIEQDNDWISHTISTRTSKYFTKLNTSIALKANYGLQKSVQLLNTNLTDINTANWGFNAKIETDFTEWFSTEYKPNWQFSKNKIQNKNNTSVKLESHRLNLNFYPEDKHFFSVKTEYLSNDLFSKNNKNLFADLLYRYTWEKRNIDFELQWTNIFNTRNYQNIQVNNYQYIETNFSLRPQQVLLKLRFSI